MPTETTLPEPVRYRLSDDKAAIIRANPPINLTVMEGAAYLAISPTKLRQEISARRVKFARIGAKIILKRAWLDELLTSAA